MDYQYSVIEVKYRFNVKRSLDDYKVTRYEKVIRTGLIQIYRCPADADEERITNLFGMTYKDENDELHYKEFDINEWKITVIKCTDFKIEF